MKNKEETESSLEGLCPYAGVCPESGYGNREMCSNDYETCEKYFQFEKGDIITEKLPLGIYNGEIIPCPEKHCGPRRLGEIGRVPK